MIDILVKLKDYVPVLQTFLWLIFILFIICVFNKSIKALINTIVKKIEKGGTFKIGPFEFGEDLLKLELVDTKSKSGEKSKFELESVEREKQRVSIYERNKGLFITHIVYPSKKDDHNFDIYIYLIRHKSRNFCDIVKAEFFFGHMWSNQIFTVKSKDGLIGIRTSAYQPFLCTCKVKFSDGSEIILDRYIDFEMKKLFPKFLSSGTNDVNC